MDRLWIRLSLLYGLVLLASNFLPLIIFAALFLLGLWELPIPEDMPADSAANIEEFFLRRLPLQVALTTIGAGVIGLVGGTIASRYLTNPLDNLQKGADAIGSQDFSYRVAEDSATREIDAVSRAFNSMADKLEKAESLRQNLLADVAHELRTPLTVIQGNLRAILDGIYPLEEQEVSRLYDQTRHLTRLVNDLHELAQAEAEQLPLDMTEISVVELMRQTADLFYMAAEEKGISLRVELLGKLGTVNGDYARLTQVLQNLLSNAIRHTPQSGQVTLRAERLDRYLKIEVSDNGEGLAAEHVPLVFNRFYRTNAARSRTADQGGAGLGLAISRAFVEAHHGQISVTSPGLERGTTFEISLPI